MNDFRRMARAIYERLLGGPPPAEYLNEVEKLNDACADWFALNKGARVEFRLPELGKSGVLMTGNLDAADAAGLCVNDEARAFIRWIDEKTGHTATLLMLQVCYLVQQLNSRREGRADEN